MLVLDSRGLLIEGRDGMEPYKLGVAQSASRVEGWEFAGSAPNLMETVQNAKATGLIGLSGQAGAIDQS